MGGSTCRARGGNRYDGALLVTAPPLLTAPILHYDAANAAIAAAESILLVTHLHPDGDAIGSLLGLAAVLRGRGKVVTPAVDDGVPPYLQFLPGADSVRGAVPSAGQPETWDLMISVDASDEERTGEWGAYGRAHTPTVINIDHHPTNTQFGAIHLIAPHAVSTTEILLDWFTRDGVLLDAAVAVPLLTGLITDTLGFTTSNVTGRTLALGQQLVEAGASITEITARTLNSKSYTTVQLWKHALQTVTLEDGVIAATISQADFKAVGIGEPTDSGLASFLNSVDEACIAVTFRETNDGGVNLSMRCKPGFDVSGVAFSLGGGGHKQAAGATIPGPLAEARARVLPLLKEAAQRGRLRIE